MEGVLLRGLSVEKVPSQDVWLVITLGVKVALGAMLSDTAKKSLTSTYAREPPSETISPHTLDRG